MHLKLMISIFLISILARAEVEMPVEKQVCSGGKTYPVHLSFDDGPKLPETAQVLDILKKNNIKATFLISTNRLNSLRTGKPTENTKKLLQLIDRMKREGHTIGSHSFEHIEHGNVQAHTDQQITENIQKSFEVIDKLNLDKPIPFRFPYGSGWLRLPSKSKTSEENNANFAENDKVTRLIKEHGYRPFHWDIDTNDWSKIKRKALPGSALEGICKNHGGIVLLHDIHPWTVENLPALIESIHSSGHGFVSSSEIIKYSEKESPMPLLSLMDQASPECFKKKLKLAQGNAVCDTNTSSKTTNSQGGVN